MNGEKKDSFVCFFSLPKSHLSEENAQAFAYLPLDIKKQLLLDRDAHGNVQVAKIETERLICGTVQVCCFVWSDLAIIIE